MGGISAESFGMRSRLYTFLRGRLEASGEKNLASRGLLGFLAKRPDGAIGPEFSDLWFLYKETRRLQPSLILEFGSGCSTVVLARALMKNAQEGSTGRVISLDAEERWAKATTAMLPPQARKFAEVVHAPTVRTTEGDFVEVRHEGLPDASPGLVYLDGPHIAPGEVAVDLLVMEDRLAPSCVVVVDGRRENLDYLVGRFRRPISVRTNPVLGNSVIRFLD